MMRLTKGNDFDTQSKVVFVVGGGHSSASLDLNVSNRQNLQWPAFGPIRWGRSLGAPPCFLSFMFEARLMWRCVQVKKGNVCCIQGSEVTAIVLKCVNVATAHAHAKTLFCTCSVKWLWMSYSSRSFIFTVTVTTICLNCVFLCGMCVWLHDKSIKQHPLVALQ